MKKEIFTDSIHEYIYWIRGCKVMFDRDLAVLYGVETRALLQAVKRNSDRFPDDFMFQLDWEETNSLKSQPLNLKEVTNPRSQIVILESGHNLKYRPYAFTEQGNAIKCFEKQTGCSGKYRNYEGIREAQRDPSFAPGVNSKAG